MTPIKVTAETSKVKIDVTFDLLKEDDVISLVEYIRTQVELKNSIAKLDDIAGRRRK